MKIKTNSNMIIGGGRNLTGQANGKNDKLIHEDGEIVGVKTNVDWNPFNNDHRDA